MLEKIALTLLFVLANAFFVAAEFAIVKVRISQLRVRIKAGSKLAKLAESIVQNLDSYLSATQLGITLSSLGLGWIGEPVVAQLIHSLMELFNLNIAPETAHSIALPVAFGLISFLHIVFGELAPKSLAILYPENVTLSLSIPLRILHFIFKPFIYILNGAANMVLKVVGLEPPKEGEIHSSDEIRLILEESSKSGAIEEAEHELIENIFDFADTPVKQIMIPRNNIEAVEKHSTADEICEMIIEKGYSRIPVYDKDIDNIVGIIHGKDLLTLIKNPTLIILDDIIRKPFFVNENERIQDVLKRMQKIHIQVAIVYNEFGGTAGLISIENILEEIVGEIQDEHDEEVDLIDTVNEGFLEVDASIAINDLNYFIKNADWQLSENENYETVGGYILNAICRIPQTGETITIGNNIFYILSANERKIDKIKIEFIKPESPKTD